MLSERIDDEPFLRLIRKWLKAGILDTDNMVIHPLTGTPQGGVISPILANIYLHYVVDLWFEKVVKKHINGKAVIFVMPMISYVFSRTSAMPKDSIELYRNDWRSSDWNYLWIRQKY